MATQPIQPNSISVASVAELARALQGNLRSPGARVGRSWPGTYDSSKSPFGGNGQQYSPGEPLQPLAESLQGPGPGANRPDPLPWQYQFQVGRNLVISPKSEAGSGTPFSLLRQIADTCDYVRLCIEMRKEQVSGLKWDIVPKDTDKFKTRREKEEYTQKLAPEIDRVKSFWKHPEGIKTKTFYDWIGPVLEEVLAIDALTLYPRMTRGGDLYSVEVKAGDTFKPLIDSFGMEPLPPAPAYQQILYGYPMGEYTAEQLIYKPKNRRAGTPYGFAPVEYFLVKVNIALRRDDFFMKYYTHGTLPDGVFIESPESWTASQILEFQAKFDDWLAGNSNHRAGSAIWIPKGGVHPSKEFKFENAFDEWLARIACLAFGVNPQHFVRMMTRATGDIQEDLQTDTGLKPLQAYLAELFTLINELYLGAPNVEFAWLEEKEDDSQAKDTGDNEAIKVGRLGIDEARMERGQEPLGVPPFILAGNTPIFLTPETIAAMIDRQINPPEPMGLGGEGGNGEGKPSKEDEKPEKNEDKFQDKKRGPNDKTPAKPSKSDDKNEDRDQSNNAQKALFTELAKYEYYAKNRIKKNDISGPLNQAS